MAIPVAPIGRAASTATHSEDLESENLGRVFRQAIDTAKPKRSADTAIAEPGTYGYREHEKNRVGIKTNSGTHESEHAYGYAVINPALKRRSTSEARSSENGLPAYHEVKGLHHQHPGTGSGKPRENNGWGDTADYRRDQAATLTDPVALRESSAVSNGYQLNQLGYGQMLASGNHQYGGAASNYQGPGGSVAMGQANESYAHMVDHDPAVAHDLGGVQTSVSLGPRGQAEVLLAREAALSGKWPDKGRQNEVLAYFEERAARRR